jgi:two-component system OmpR family sensor kinase
LSDPTPSATASPAPSARPFGGGRPRTRLSLRTRVAVNVVAVTAIIQFILGVVVFQYFRSTVDEFFSSRLASRLRWAAAEMAQSPGVPNNAEMGRLAEHRLVLFSSLLLVLRDRDGRVIAVSDPNADISRFTPPKVNGSEVEIEMVPVSGFALNGADEPLPARTATLEVPLPGAPGKRAFITAAVSNASAAEMNQLIGTAVLLASAVGLLATGCAAWFITGLSLKPLNQLHSVAEEFSLERLDKPSQLEPQIPELSQLAAELDAARTRIHLALQANERFIANVSHELKTPVAVLRTEAQNLDNSDIPPETRVFVRSVIEETRRLGTMVDSFLTLAAVRSGRALTATRPVYINDVVVESFAHAAAMARQHRVGLVPKLHDTDDDLMVAGDADLLRILLDNLIRNAVRFSPPDSAVTASVTADEHNVVVAIVDTGPGIPDELLPTLFERFARAEPAPTGRGHGLGLSIAQGIAELHGGLIATTNLSGGGCRFSLTLPRVRSPRVATGVDSAPNDPRANGTLSAPSVSTSVAR